MLQEKHAYVTSFRKINTPAHFMPHAYQHNYIQGIIIIKPIIVII
jgi:hypothetical protein